MKTSYLIKFPFLILLITAYGCNQKRAQDKKDDRPEQQVVTQDDSTTEINPLDKIEKTIFYVMATNGLSLRKEPYLNSEKIAAMPKGSALKMTEALYTADTIIDYIPGSMVAVDYQGEKGYAYSGYLTAYKIPEKPIQGEEYSASIKEVFPTVTYLEQENSPDFHQGYNSDLKLPYCSWPEAFYIAKSIYGIPESIAYPNPKGMLTETISQSDKDKDIWISDLHITRTKFKLDTLHYVYRAEGYGWQVKIFETAENKIQINHIAFVD